MRPEGSKGARSKFALRPSERPQTFPGPLAIDRHGDSVLMQTAVAKVSLEQLMWACVSNLWRLAGLHFGGYVP